MGIVPSLEAEQEEVIEVIGREQGYRVHHVEPGSPGAVAGLASILDYIVVANGVRVDQDDGRLVEMIAASNGVPLRLCVFNTHTLQTRELTLVPNDTWGGKGLLGITIRFDVLHAPDAHTLHVLDVYDESPASLAGLDPFNDYIIAVGDLLFDGLNEFNDIIVHNVHRPVLLYVYNAATEAVREASIVPNDQWGGEGLLGCALGAGYLHSLPKSRLRANRGLCAAAGAASTAAASPEPRYELPPATGSMPHGAEGQAGNTPATDTRAPAGALEPAGNLAAEPGPGQSVAAVAPPAAPPGRGGEQPPEG